MQILTNLKQDLCEDGNPMEITPSDRADSVRLWSGREARVIHSIVNCALALKDYQLAMSLLGQLCERYVTKLMFNLIFNCLLNCSF